MKRTTEMLAGSEAAGFTNAATLLRFANRVLVLDDERRCSWVVLQALDQAEQELRDAVDEDDDMNVVDARLAALRLRLGLSSVRDIITAGELADGDATTAIALAAMECRKLATGQQTHDPDGESAAMMPAGRYWVGDLCYALPDAWDEVCSRGYGVHALSDGRRIAKFATIHGDGDYRDESGREYAVDSGTLGCILAADIRDTSRPGLGLGEFVIASAPFTPRLEGSQLHLAGVTIELDPPVES